MKKSPLGREIRSTIRSPLMTSARKGSNSAKAIVRVLLRRMASKKTVSEKKALRRMVSESTTAINALLATKSLLHAL